MGWRLAKRGLSCSQRGYMHVEELRQSPIAPPQCETTAWDHYHQQLPIPLTLRPVSVPPRRTFNTPSTFKEERASSVTGFHSGSCKVVCGYWFSSVSSCFSSTGVERTLKQLILLCAIWNRLKKPAVPSVELWNKTTVIYYQQNTLLANEKGSFLSFQTSKKRPRQISQGIGHSPSLALLNYLHSVSVFGTAALTYVYVSSFIMMNSCPWAMERLTGGEAEGAWECLNKFSRLRW